MTALSPNRFFSPDPTLLKLAREIYAHASSLPIISPHGHVDPGLFSDPSTTFGSPADLFILHDHYILRMLYSQGIPLEKLGVPRRDGKPVEADHRVIWRIFCSHFHLFRGTPSALWLRHSLAEVFHIEAKPSASNADALFDTLSQMLAMPEFSPRALFIRFNIRILCTTDAAADPLDSHQAIRESGWEGEIRPTFRPDKVVNIDAPDWLENICRLSEVSDLEIKDYRTFVQALEKRREFFKSLGGTATDHAVSTPASAPLTNAQAKKIFQRALKGQSESSDASAFTAHMLMEMARMSLEDGLVMQLHPGALRDHNHSLFVEFGPDRGGDIPLQTEYTRNLLPLLNGFGNDPHLTLILFTLDESNYSRELAPLAGHYPAVKLGSPWWFHDSLNGIKRFFDQVVETAGLHNTSGFTDDSRSFCSIPARHDTWRRASANWLAGLVANHIIDIEDAHEMMNELAVNLARRTYKLDGWAF